MLRSFCFPNRAHRAVTTGPSSGSTTALAGVAPAATNEGDTTAQSRASSGPVGARRRFLPFRQPGLGQSTGNAQNTLAARQTEPQAHAPQECQLDLVPQKVIKNVDQYLSPADSKALAQTAKFLSDPTTGSPRYELVCTMADIDAMIKNPDGAKRVKGTASNVSGQTDGCCTESDLVKPQYMEDYYSVVLPKDVTDEQIKNLRNKGLLDTVEHLDLSDCEQLTDMGISYLSGLSVKSLSISRCGQLTHEIFKNIAQLEHLESLKIHSLRQLEDESSEYLSKLQNLRTLELSYSTQLVSEKTAKHIGQLSNLRNLNLSGASWLKDDGIAHIAQLQNLRTLNLQSCYRLTAESGNHIAQLKNLHTLDISSCSDLTEQVVENLIPLNKSLLRLNVSYIDAHTDDACVHIAKLQKLQTLNISVHHRGDANHLGISNQACGVLVEGLKNLQTLIMQNNKRMTHEGIEHLAKLENLRTLDIRGFVGLTKKVCQKLVKLENLQSLDISAYDSTNRVLTDNACFYLAKHKQLHTLRLRYYDNLTEKSYKWLARLEKLEILDITGCSGLKDKPFNQPSSHKRVNPLVIVTNSQYWD